MFRRTLELALLVMGCDKPVEQPPPVAPVVASTPQPFPPPPAPVVASVEQAPPPPPPPPAPIDEPIGSPVSNAATTSKGNVKDADQVIVGLRPQFKACYQKVRGSGPDIQGMVSCGVRITKDGKVAAVSVTRRAYLPDPLVQCLVGVVKTAKFGPLEEETVIQVPIRFGLND